ncbi:MAG: YdbL family protein [Candidatus Omnitrophica bacterium]|nr:YdbL family protein [Candidatus Omnitrophota bacterium]
MLKRQCTMTLGILLAGGGLLGVAACRATVAGDPDRPIKIEAHITLDVRQVKETASSIEDMVNPEPKSAQKPRSRLGDWLVPSAWAASPQLKFMTPEAQRAIDSRRDRYKQLKEYKMKGWVGENNQGLVSALVSTPEVTALVEQENRDRELIYRTIIEQNNLPGDAMATVKAAFAQEQRERAEPGEKIQQPSGEWVTK